MSRHQVCVSREIEQELLSVVARLGKRLTEERRVVMKARIEELIAFATSVPVSTRGALSRDAKDDHYLSLCKQTLHRHKPAEPPRSHLAALGSGDEEARARENR